MSNLWKLVDSHHDLDPRSLAAALSEQCQAGLEDPRTLQLARECWHALQGWNVPLPAVPEALEPVGKFTGLERRIGLVTTSENILGFLRELSLQLTAETKIIIGCSSALILDHLLQRVTQDIHLVDEIPQALRELHAELASAESVYKLHLAHFQSHYLPLGWESRCVSLPPLRRLQVWRVASLDVYTGKLFSRREKDRRDLVALQAAFPLDQVKAHVLTSCSKLLLDPLLRSQFADNWYVLYGAEWA